MMSLVLAALLLLAVKAHGLSLDYYDDKCPGAEAAVTAAVRQAMAKDSTVPAGLLRLHFHDCFVRVRYPFVLFSIYKLRFFLNFFCRDLSTK